MRENVYVIEVEEFFEGNKNFIHVKTVNMHKLLFSADNHLFALDHLYSNFIHSEQSVDDLKTNQSLMSF